MMKLPADLVSRLSSPYAGRSVCVTGGAGFIGGHLVDALMSLGAKITVVDDLSNSTPEHLAELIELEPQRVRFVHGSLLDDDALDQGFEGCDVVFHLAAVGSIPLSIAEPQRAWSVNATGTVRVLQACRRHSIKRLVMTSSSSVYGETGLAPGVPPAPRVETQVPMPVSPYAASKLSAESAVKAWAQSYNLSALSLRLFNVFGPRQRADSPYSAVIPAWARALSAGKAPTIFGDGQQTRDFTPVANVVAALLLAGATTRELRGEAVNIGTGTRTTLLELWKMMAEAFGNPGLQPIFQVPRMGEVKHSSADITLAKNLLGYQPVVGLNEAVADTVQFYKRVLEGTRR